VKMPARMARTRSAGVQAGVAASGMSTAKMSASKTPMSTAATTMLSKRLRTKKNGTQQANQREGNCAQESNREGVSDTHGLPPQRMYFDFTPPARPHWSAVTGSQVTFMRPVGAHPNVAPMRR